ncbi:MAG TPA: acireductone synthase [Oculatellaceae cyanobacterium]|jgi:enolase-phosphatase E1
MARFILTDIEGTTTDIHFVHRVLFPYSAERMSAFIQENLDNPDVRVALDSVKKTVLDEQGVTITDTQAVETLLQWIREDRKHGALKQLQGMIWRHGYESGAYRGHVYEDVPAALERWRQQGIGLGIYSSGSVQAQKLLFRYSTAGDLTPYFSHYFDTAVGAKKETASYQKIAETLQLPPQEILFLSDVEAELDAAQTAGFQTIQLVRPETTPSTKHQTAPDFSSITPEAL